MSRVVPSCLCCAGLGRHGLAKGWLQHQRGDASETVGTEAAPVFFTGYHDGSLLVAQTDDVFKGVTVNADIDANERNSGAIESSVSGIALDTSWL